MTQPDTRAGRSPDEAQPRSTCGVCKGKKYIEGRRVMGGDNDRTNVIECGECDGEGTVPAAGDLAQWRDKALRLISEAKFPVAYRLKELRAHLAAMPAQDSSKPESVAVRHHREVRIRTALQVYRASPAGLEDMDTAARTILRELHLQPAQDPNAELLAALDEIAWPLTGDPECAGTTWRYKTADEMREIARDAIAQAEKGAPAVSAAELLAALRDAHGLQQADSYHFFKCAKCDLIRQAGKGAAE